MPGDPLGDKARDLNQQMLETGLDSLSSTDLQIIFHQQIIGRFDRLDHRLANLSDVTPPNRRRDFRIGGLGAAIAAILSGVAIIIKEFVASR